MDSVFVQRDEVGNLVGVYARMQPGLAEEELAELDPVVVAFLTGLASLDGTLRAEA